MELILNKTAVDYQDSLRNFNIIVNELGLFLCKIGI